jgi:hypothetical protein
MYSSLKLQVQSVKGIGDHGHQDVEVHLHKDGGREGVEIEELDRLGNDILHPPPMGVVAGDAFHRGRNIVGDQEGWLFVPVSPDDDLPELPFIILQGDKGLVVRIGVLPFVVGDMNLLPGLKFIQVSDQLQVPPPECNKPDSLTVQLEVQIDDAPVRQTKTDGILHKSLLELQDMHFIQGIGIGGHGCAFGQDIENGEQSQAGIEGMASQRGVPLCADELQGQKGQKITDCRNNLGPRQTGRTDQFRRLKLFQKRCEQKDPCRIADKMPPFHLLDDDACRLLRDLRFLDGQTDLQTGATGELGESLFRQDPLRHPDGDVYTIFGKQLADLSCGEVFLPPGEDLSAGLGSATITGGATFRLQAFYFP